MLCKELNDIKDACSRFQIVETLELAIVVRQAGRSIAWISH